MATQSTTAGNERHVLRNWVRIVATRSGKSSRRLFRQAALLFFMWVSGCLSGANALHAQTTSIRGFVDVLAGYRGDSLSFGFGEQDLFITSELSDRISFLGESVFRFDPFSNTEFAVSIERIVLKYGLVGNHNLLVGKHHTPLNYWNDTYHHGRLFFPTIERPLIFAADIIPLHTTGVGLQGHNLGKIKFGYDVMVGNGLGASEIADNNRHKSLTTALHIKPMENLRLGASYYRDVISAGSFVHDKLIEWKVKQHLITGSVAYFGKKVELLAESTLGINHTDTTGNRRSWGSYVYGGYRIGEKLVPYFRVDRLDFQHGELYFTKDNTTALVAGIRYQINYLAVIKLEYQHLNAELSREYNKLTAQFAIGF